MKANDKHNSLDSVCNNFCWLKKELARLKKLLSVAPAASSHSVRGVISPSYRFMPRRGTESSDRQAFSAFSPAVCQYTSSPHGRASFTESVHTFSFDITGLKSPFHESVLKIILQNAKNPALLLPNQMVRQLEKLREGLGDYFTGGSPCQGLIPFFQGRQGRLW